jgi:S1-C subfamily serine protease
MMSLHIAWPHIRECLAAIVPKFSTTKRAFPEVMGTGFLVSASGIVCTCRHVAEAFDKLTKPEGYAAIPALALLFTKDPSTGYWGFLQFEIDHIGSATVSGDTTAYAGPRPPDVAYLFLNVTETPFLRIGDAPIVEGEAVGVGGFPMGTDLLKAPGWLHQITPTVMTGIVSAVLPHHLHPTPHGLLVHAQTLPGSSGSPVFRPDGSVIGMVYGGANDPILIGQERLVVPLPTSLAMCVSRDLIAGSLRGAETAAAGLQGRPTLAERIAEGERQTLTLGDSVFEQWPPRTRGKGP